MKTVCSKDLCTGCMLCVNVCTKQAIQIEDGFVTLNAVINEERCVQCGRCKDFCPQSQGIEKFKPSTWYQGWADDADVRKGSSSGGAATAIALAFIRNGGVCVSCEFTDGRFAFSKADAEDSVLQFRGSKYVKSDPNEAYLLVKNEIQEGKKVLFIGLPCQVAGIKRFIGDTDHLYTIDLICHGTPSTKLLQMFLSESGVDIRNISDIKFRNKTKFYISTDKRPISRSGRRDLYMAYFLKKLFYTNNCYQCVYSTIERCSDITLGDSWGSSLPMEETKQGISLILCQTEKGRQILRQASIHLEEVDLDRAVSANTNLSHPSVAPEERDVFFKSLFLKNSFNYAIRKAFPKAYYKYRIIEMLKKDK